MSEIYLVVVSYDIAHPYRLNRVAKVLEAAGVRVQKSVFECGLTPDALKALRLRLRRLIDPAEDHILIIPVCMRCRHHICWQGKLPDASTAPHWII
ncbi:CRISPR-associated endonuclease Cas2 [Nitrosomonas sp. wSCUT-2]